MCVALWLFVLTVAPRVVCLLPLCIPQILQLVQRVVVYGRSSSIITDSASVRDELNFCSQRGYALREEGYSPWQ